MAGATAAAMQGFDADLHAVPPPILSIAGSVAVASRIYRTRDPSIRARLMECLGAQMGQEEEVALQAVQRERGIQGDWLHRVTAIPGRPPVQRARSAQPPMGCAVARNFKARAACTMNGGTHVLGTPPLTEMPHPPIGPKPQQGLRPRLKVRSLPAEASVPQQKSATTQSTEVSTGDTHGRCALALRPTYCSSKTSLDEVTIASREEDLLLD